MRIEANETLHFQNLNECVRSCGDRDIYIDSCIGQRYIGAGSAGKRIHIKGTPGNALGAYLDGTDIIVEGNAQDAIGDTMNAGSIVVYGNAGDAAGYAMRGGKIFIRGDVGYRCGIHMKAYKENKPVIVIGGRAGSFLGEYQAGGLIIVLGLGRDKKPLVGNFCGTGMHGGEMYIRGELPAGLPEQIKSEKLAGISDGWVRSVLEEYAAAFGLDAETLISSVYYRLTPDSENPYRRMYTNN